MGLKAKSVFCTSTQTLRCKVVTLPRQWTASGCNEVGIWQR
jgi:hypothetical protein